MKDSLAAQHHGVPWSDARETVLVLRLGVLAGRDRNQIAQAELLAQVPSFSMSSMIRRPPAVHLAWGWEGHNWSGPRWVWG